MPRVPLTMPKMSMTMEFGTIVEWLVDEGAEVHQGDAVLVVTTDKVDMDVEAMTDGVLVQKLATDGDEVPVGEPIGYIESETDDLLGDLFAPPAATPPEEAGPPEVGTGPEPDAVAPAESDEVAPAPTGDALQPESEAGHPRPRAVPLARKLAQEAGIDLATVTPTGPTGTIRARDVRAAIEAAAAAPAPAAAPVQPVEAAQPATAAQAPAAPATGELLGDAKTRRMRVATAKALEASALIPQFTAYRTLDLSRLAVARKASLSGVSWTTILVRAYAMTLREYPALNGYWVGTGVQPNGHVGVALAVDTPVGLLAPVLRDPDKLSIRALNDAIKALAASVKGGQIDPDSLSGGTGTVSNLGKFGIDRFNALLTPPQATALSLGAVGPRPVFDAEASVRARIGCDVGLTIDHRVADGADAARALQTVQDILDDPFLLLG